MASKSFQSVLDGNKYPAKKHAERVSEVIKRQVPDLSGVLYVEGHKTRMIEDCDQEEHFRQRRHFYYLTGCDLPDCHYLFDMSTQKSCLFIPPIDPESVIWSGLPLSAEEARKLYDVDEVRYTTDVNTALGALAPASKAVFAIPNQVSDDITFLQFDEKNFSVLKGAIETCRVVKDEYEVALISKANAISNIAHRDVLSMVRHAKNEAELEGAFLGDCTANGGKQMAYHPIVASGRAAATLHYVKNDAPLAGKLNLLLDAGAEYDCYASDITRTLPISGKFSTESRAIYDIVLRMQLECTAMLKEGVLWDDVHVAAHKIAINGLLKLGILQGDADEILAARTSVAFFPHGLGHYLGMDTHDVGGNANYADTDSMFRYLRVRGKLPKGSVVTVEPGIYFCDFIINPYLEDARHAKFINKEVLDKYWDVGGVRIEDNVLVTENGYTNLTEVPKDPDELERTIQAS